MYWHISLTLEGSRERLTPKFAYQTNTFSGTAYVRTINWSGGPSVSVSGPGVRPSTGELTDLDRHGSMLLTFLPYEVLLQLEEKANELMQSARSALGLVNSAIIPKMPRES